MRIEIAQQAPCGRSPTVSHRPSSAASHRRTCSRSTSRYATHTHAQQQQQRAGLQQRPHLAALLAAREGAAPVSPSVRSNKAALTRYIKLRVPAGTLEKLSCDDTRAGSLHHVDALDWYPRGERERRMRKRAVATPGMRTCRTQSFAATTLSHTCICKHRRCPHVHHRFAKRLQGGR